MLAASLLALRLLLLVGAAAAGAVGVSGGGLLWCVAKNNAEDGALQSAIDWACSVDGGSADCAAIQQGAACFNPPDLQQHASYAFNDYFLRSGGAASPAACDFSGAAALTALNPKILGGQLYPHATTVDPPLANCFAGHGSCMFPSSASPKNGSFTGTTTYGPTGADFSNSFSWKLNFWSLLLHISSPVMFCAATHVL